ncbi:multiubiquitin domain-containing protein [Agreia sp. PsM10]|uniref:multiubiquitin domain-containing protein n=1 Tax=Agreia sp. PsM10 TaxID=3030533 RepID=UPI00263B5E39|nr:multiubiquitin domain-containing protein [Agreia sp. PsM10]MDN4640763.1 multiubiquitin domain-containing protein [Agreia sp. PsM10]
MGTSESRAKIRFTIDGIEYSTRDDDQEAANLLRLAGRDPDVFDLARIVPGDDPDVLKDGKVLDLKEGDAFLALKQRVLLTFTIDGNSYSTRDDDQEAASLLRLAGLDPAHFDLAKIKANGEITVLRDVKVIDLREGDAFVSVAQVASWTIVVNTVPAAVDDEEVDYDKVVQLAFPVPPSPDTRFTVTFRKAKEPKEGTLKAGKTVIVKKEGTIFNVKATGKS